MKQLAKSLFVAVLIAPAAGHAQSLLTFDGLPTQQQAPSLDYTFIPNGHGGLIWNNFGVLNGTIRPAGEGYHAGVVSQNNVAFNFNGDPASISVAAGLFNLDSAYLTHALNLDTPLTIRVQGLVASTVLYDNTYTVYRTDPTLVNFNYVGVDRITFVSSPNQQFAMDNLVVTVPEPSTLGLLIVGAACVGAGRFSRRFGKETHVS